MRWWDPVSTEAAKAGAETLNCSRLFTLQLMKVLVHQEHPFHCVSGLVTKLI